MSQRACIRTEREVRLEHLNSSRERSEIELAVVHFHPRGVGLVAQTQVEGEMIRHPSIILKIRSKHVGALAPSASDYSAPLAVGQSKIEVSLTEAECAAGGRAGESACKVHETQLSIVARIIAVDALPPELKAGVEH